MYLLFLTKLELYIQILRTNQITSLNFTKANKLQSSTTTQQSHSHKHLQLRHTIHSQISVKQNHLNQIKKGGIILFNYKTFFDCKI